MRKIRKLESEILKLESELNFHKWLDQYCKNKDLKLQRVILGEIKMKKRELTILKISLEE